MKIHEYGDPHNPHIMLIHGGGNAWWNYHRQAMILSKQYHVILPTLNGHGEEYAESYKSTKDSAEQCIEIVDRYCDGHLYLLSGVSLGGQIVIEMLSVRKDITKKAIIDGCICYPQPILADLCMLIVRFFGFLMFSRVSCKLQLLMLRKMPKLSFSEEMEQYYLQDMPNLRKETLYAIYQTYMKDYTLKESIAQTQAQIQYWYGSKEMKCVKKSAQLFKNYVPSCQIVEAKGYNHGYLAIYMPDEWLARVNLFLNTNETIE